MPLDKEATSNRVSTNMRSVFCTAGAPEKMISDDGPHFIARAFQLFLSWWGIEHLTSSPHCIQSNGRAEPAVKAASKLTRRCWTPTEAWTSRGGPWTRDVLQQRNTPGPDGRSPAQIMFGRPIRDTPPAHRRAFNLCWQRGADEADAAGSAFKNSEEPRYNRHARHLPGMRVGTGSQVAAQNHSTKR